MAVARTEAVHMAAATTTTICQLLRHSQEPAAATAHTAAAMAVATAMAITTIQLSLHWQRLALQLRPLSRQRQARASSRSALTIQSTTWHNSPRQVPATAAICAAWTRLVTPSPIRRRPALATWRPQLQRQVLETDSPTRQSHSVRLPSDKPTTILYINIYTKNFHFFRIYFINIR